MKNLKERSCVAVLSQKLLGEEFFSRLEKANIIYKQTGSKYFVILSEAANSDKILQHINDKFKIPSNLILTVKNSKDTIGEAIFLKKNIVIGYNIKQVFLVSSDYHIDYRVKIIFDYVFNNETRIKYCKSKTNKIKNKKVILNQLKSLQYFFNLTKKSHSLENMLMNHPLYGNKK